MTNKDNEDNENKLNVSDITSEDAAGIFQKMNWNLTQHDIDKDIREGAPVNENGNINMVKYGAWLLREAGDDIHE